MDRDKVGVKLVKKIAKTIEKNLKKYESKCTFCNEFFHPIHNSQIFFYFGCSLLIFSFVLLIYKWTAAFDVFEAKIPILPLDFYLYLSSYWVIILFKIFIFTDTHMYSSHFNVERGHSFVFCNNIRCKYSAGSVCVAFEFAFSWKFMAFCWIFVYNCVAMPIVTSYGIS